MFVIQFINIQINIPRGYSIIFSANNSREIFPYSNTSFMDYTDRVKESANNLELTR